MGEDSEGFGENFSFSFWELDLGGGIVVGRG